MGNIIHPNYNPYEDHHGCLPWIIGCLLVCICLFSGCRTKYVPVETVRLDSVYFNREYRDSIYLKDSVFVREKGDTVYVDKFKYLYKEVNRTDTFYVSHTDTVATVVEVEKKLSRWQSFKMEFGGIAFGVCVGLMLILVYTIYRKK